METEIKNVTKKLICAILPTHENKQNIKIALDFAIANFKYHKFLEPNRKAIFLQANGICTKLTIHSHTERADRLGRLINSLPAVGDYETSTEWNVLKFILLVSNSVTNQPFLLKSANSQRAGSLQQEFDWGKYLLDGLEPLQSFASSESDCSSEVDDDATCSTLCQTQLLPMVPESSQKRPTSRNQRQTAQELLSSTLYPDFWHNADLHQVEVQTELMKAWKVNLTLPHTKMSTPPLPEYVLVREVLWMIIGSMPSHILNLPEKNSNFDYLNCFVSDMQFQSGLHSLLTWFYHQGKMLSTVDHFVHEASTLFNPDIPRSYRALAVGLARCLKDLSVHAHQLQETIRNDGGSWTLLRLREDLEPHLKVLPLLNELVREATKHGPSVDNCKKASSFLTSLGHMVAKEEALGHRDISELLFCLWVRALQPLLSVIDAWFSTGQVCQAAHEFCIEKDPGVLIKSPQFWRSGLTCRTDCTSVFTPIMTELLEMCRTLLVLSMLPNKAALIEKKSVYDEFIDGLLQSLDIPPLPNNSTVQIADSSPAKMLPVPCRTFSDRVFAANFARLLSLSEDKRPATGQHKDIRPFSDYGVDVFHGLFTRSPMLLPHLLQQYLYPPILARAIEVNTCFLKELQSSYDLHNYLVHIKELFLLKPNSSLTNFYVSVFMQMQNGEEWRNEYNLNTGLQQAISESMPHLANKVRLVLARDDSQSTPVGSQISLLQGLNIVIKVPWPLSIVLTDDILLTYSQVWRFILSLKYAVYCLHQCHFLDLTVRGKPVWTQMEERRMCLQRFQLLHFLKSLQDFILSWVLVAGTKNQEDVALCRNLSEVIETHDNYLQSLHNRCFQSDKVVPLRNILMKVLKSAVDFGNCWKVNQLTQSKLQETREYFNRSEAFLISLLDDAKKRGSVPHLEALYFALS